LAVVLLPSLIKGMTILNPMLLPMATVLTIAMRRAVIASKTRVLMRTSFSFRTG